MPAGFPSPTAALAQIVECLAPICGNPRIHTGAFGTGRTLSCCAPGEQPSCLLRVEDAGIRGDGGPLGVQGCDELMMDVVVTYSECFMSQTVSGKTRTAADLTADGLDLVVSAWEAIGRIACCVGAHGQPWNSVIRFSGVNHTPPEAGCAGWVLRLEVDLVMCGPCESADAPGVSGDVWVQALTVEGSAGG